MATAEWQATTITVPSANPELFDSATLFGKVATIPGSHDIFLCYRNNTGTHIGRFTLDGTLLYSFAPIFEPDHLMKVIGNYLVLAQFASVSFAVYSLIGDLVNRFQAKLYDYQLLSICAYDNSPSVLIAYRAMALTRPTEKHKVGYKAKKTWVSTINLLTAEREHAFKIPFVIDDLRYSPNNFYVSDKNCKVFHQTVETNQWPKSGDWQLINTPMGVNDMTCDCAGNVLLSNLYAPTERQIYISTTDTCRTILLSDSLGSDGYVSEQRAIADCGTIIITTNTTLTYYR